MTIRVAVIGAGGRMGAQTCRALADVEDLELVAAVGRSHAGQTVGAVAGTDSEVTIVSSIDELDAANVDVAVEFTGPETAGKHLLDLLERQVHVVVGATGIDDSALEHARQLAQAGPARALVAPNFALGAVLMMQFAQQAAAVLPNVEIVELHHDRKIDAPSGTALRTAELIASTRSSTPEDIGGDDVHPGARGATHEGVQIHSVRLPGLLAHQEVIFGGQGEALTVRHDAFDRSSFMPGVLLACRRVGTLDGLAVGLEHVL